MIDVLESLASPRVATAIAAPGAREGYWAGAPSAVQVDGSIWLAYRLRRPIDLGRGYANVVARSADGVRFDTVAVVTSSQFRCASLERPSLVTLADGTWRLYVSCATPGSKHWWVEAIDAAAPEDLPHGNRSVVLDAGDAAWKDVVVKRAGDGWRMWACRHPLDSDDDAADRMSTWYATSSDGLAWTLVGEALGPRAGTWDARGARVADVVQAGSGWWALYDGRRSAEENWRERCGLAVGEAPHALNAVAGPVPDEVGKATRYASLVPQAEGWRIYFEATVADGPHDLRTVYVPRPSGASQS
jgi:hypothetical protein